MRPTDHCSVGSDCPGGRGVCTLNRCLPAISLGDVCQSSYESIAGASCQPSESDSTLRCWPSLAEGAVCDGVDAVGSVVARPLAYPIDAPCSYSYLIGDTNSYCIVYNSIDTRLCRYGCAPGHDCFDYVTGSEDLFCVSNSGSGGDCELDSTCEAGLVCGYRYETSAGSDQT